MKLSIEEIAKVLGGQKPKKKYVLRHASIDSRQIVQAKRTLFFALKGKHVDGHDYISALYKKGVKHFVVRKKPKGKFADAYFIEVKNVERALQKLAAYYRTQIDAVVIGITGSNGKTIVKEWLATMLSEVGQTAKNPKSYNSQIGVPLSIFQIERKDKYAILEAGISKLGEMSKLQKMIAPDLGIMTNIGSAHDEGFENKIVKASEKLKLFKNANQLIYCSDQSWAKKINFPAKAEQLTWTKKKKSFVSQVVFEVGDKQSKIHLQHNGHALSFSIGFTDDASLENAVHCICACLALKLHADQIQTGLNKLYSVDMRLQMLAGENQCTLINDAYTADIESLKAGLDFQDRQGQTKIKTVILSDFLQSGKGSQSLYKQIAELLLQYKVQKVIGIGSEVVMLDKYLGNKMLRSFYESTATFLQHLSDANHINEIILVKGARRFKFEQIIARLTERQHDAVLQVDLSAMTQNVIFFQKKLKKQTKLLAMIKASGYGSGSIQVANLLEKSKVDYFGVAYVDEGIALRKKGIRKPILVLNCPPSSFNSLLAFDLEPELYAIDQLQNLIDHLEDGQHIKIHIKLDSGMNRLGFIESEWNTLVELLASAKKKIKVQSIFTHLAASESPDEDKFSKQQITLYNKGYNHISKRLKIKPTKHALNTAGILRFPQFHYGMVRLGLGLYGVDPSAQADARLQEVLSFKAKISQIKHLLPGDTVGYNRMGKVKTPKTIAIINVGYADGLLRKAGNGRFKMHINGKLAPTIGNICMDMCMIDISKIDNVKVNDEVIIFGKDHSVLKLCKALDTIPYEVYTSIAERIKRVYYQE